MMEQEVVSPQIVAFLDAYSVLPTFEEINEHLEVLEGDTEEVIGILREDLQKVAKHLRSVLVASRAFMEAWDSLLFAAIAADVEIPGTLIGGLLAESLKLANMMADHGGGGNDDASN